MISTIKQIIKKLLPEQALRYEAYKRLIKKTDSYLYSTGWMQSLKEKKTVDKNGNPIPWLNFPVIKLLNDRLNKEMNLFEFGGGYSTFFYADRVKTVTTVEYDGEWFKYITSNCPDNVEIIFQNKDINGNYCRSIKSTKRQYDVVIVDGRDRINCIKQSVSSLTPGGIILLDDSERERYQEGIEYLSLECGFRALTIEGLKATDTETFQSTIFYRDSNCLGI